MKKREKEREEEKFNYVSIQGIFLKKESFLKYLNIVTRNNTL